VCLINLPSDAKPFSLDQFVELQEKYIKNKTTLLISKNIEIERAVDDLIQVICS